MTVAALETENLVKEYGSLRAVNDVSFRVEPGEVFGLLGPNGAGKTSIISVIVTLEKATSGAVRVFGHEVARETRSAKMVTGWVPQEVINHGYFSLEEILHFQSGYYGIRNNTERVNELIDRLRMGEHRHKKVRQLSGGLKRRLMIAKALVHRPRLLLLDEPTAGVDIELRSTLWEFVRELRKEGVSVLLTTHYLEEAEQLCDRVAFLHKGQLCKVGSTRELVKNLTTRRVRFQLRQSLAPIVHPCLVEQKPNLIEFRLPATQGVGDLMAELRLDLRLLADIEVVEGTLEDAFRLVLGNMS